MRVTHLDLGRHMRGGQFQVLQLMEELRAHGVAQTLLGPHGDRFSIRELREQADIIHAHDARSHTYAALLARAPLIVSRRVAFPVKRTWMSRWKYRQPALYLAVSQYVAGKLIEAGVPPRKIQIVYDGVRLLPVSTRTGPLIAVASHDPMKGSDLIRQSGIEVEFVTNLPDALKTARGLLYITREEGLGSAALMAMGAGVPVVASNIGGLPEIVGHEKTGLLVANDPAEIAAAAVQLHQPQSAHWAEKGRELVQNRFLASHCAEATLAAYKQVLRQA